MAWKQRHAKLMFSKFEASGGTCLLELKMAGLMGQTHTVSFNLPLLLLFVPPFSIYSARKT